MIFYLGTHMPTWLHRTTVPLFVSRRRLKRAPSFKYKPATCRWALDSGGFTELSHHGGWTIDARQYVDECRHFMQIGNVSWIAPQDWMCEPWIVEKTGLSVEEHQRRTVQNFVELKSIDDELPFIPVLQGWEPDDYASHVRMYDTYGVDLRDYKVVGVGSVCRRQGTPAAVAVFDTIDLALPGVALHGFGFKTRGLPELKMRVASADSLAWSYRARRAGQREGHPHQSCANCMTFALEWRESLLRTLDRATDAEQLRLRW